jgi:hypothetical protein
MPQTSALRPELENEWRERVSAASFAYELARMQAAAAMRFCEHDHFSGSEIAELREVQRRESDALQEYMRVLKIFHDMVVEGVVPPS